MFDAIKVILTDLSQRRLSNEFRLKNIISYKLLPILSIQKDHDKRSVYFFEVRPSVTVQKFDSFISDIHTQTFG